MQVMQLPKHLLLLAAALTASGAGRAAAQEFNAVPARTNCTANTVTVDARSDIECAMKSSQVSSSLSFSFINGVCVLSNNSDCAASNAANVFKRRIITPTVISHPGYERQIGSRRFWVFQQRQTGLLAFNRNWTEYEQGFGNGTDGNDTEFWSGLLQINAFTKSHTNTLRIEMTTVDGHFYVEEWLNFTVADASTNYTLTCGAMIAGSSNVSGDTMGRHNGMQFSTIDRDNDALSGSCSSNSGEAGFWFNHCWAINPNGLYPPGSMTAVNFTFISSDYVETNKPLRAIRMMLQL